MGEAFEKFPSLLLCGQNSAACRKFPIFLLMLSEMRFLSLQGARAGKKITAVPKRVSSGTAVKMGVKNHPAGRSGDSKRYSIEADGAGLPPVTDARLMGCEKG